MSKRKNQLAHETSPYLLQHADNPVEWYPWGQETIALARREDKPILLSIGYSACHWCHVMAHESFEDSQTAEIMNRYFINIKVDREERPDIDKIYQLCYQLLTHQAGGWPLTMFLTPQEHIPYFGGTYFPKIERFNMPAFSHILKQAAEFYQRGKSNIAEHNTSFSQALQSISAPTEPVDNNLDLLDQAVEEISSSFDAENGGFGQAPKFPHATTIEFLLRRWFMSKKSDVDVFNMATTTLNKMGQGGIYDHLGGGFCRYSVDNYWLIPHFEKMLYDNGPLLSLYCYGWLATKSDFYKDIAVETAEWVMREMQAPEGGYYSSLDADSEGEEGKFYAWDRDEVKRILDPDEFKMIELYYGLNNNENFENKWHFHIAMPLEKVANSLSLNLGETKLKLNTARKKLFNIRKQRIHPGRDEKIFTSWNALMIKAMAIAGRILEREDFIESAQKAFDFIQTVLWKNGKLLATYKDGKAHLNAYLDDYVFLIDAALELLQSRWRASDLLWSQELADCLLDHFEDKDDGGFFFTSDDHESLIYRPKPMADESTPAGNAIAAYALTRLGHLTGRMQYVNAAQNVIASSSASMNRSPQAHAALLIALEESLIPPRSIIIRGKNMLVWQKKVSEDYAPNQLCFAIPDNEANLPGLLAERKPADDTIAYVCTESTCLAPLGSLEALTEIVI